MKESAKRGQGKRRVESRVYYLAHKTEHNAYTAAYYQAHKDERLADAADYRKTHQEENKAKCRQYYQAHREQLLAYRRNRQGTARDQIRAGNNLRKARQRNAPICDFTATQWKAMKAAYGQCCAYCGKKSRKLTMDHVIPLARSGSHMASNIVPACLDCNMHKKVGPPTSHQQIMAELLS